MGLFSFVSSTVKGASRSFDDLINAGYPESTAKKILSGELPMDTASRMQRAMEQGYRQEVFHAGSPELARADAIDPDAGRFERAGSGAFMTNSPVLGNTYMPPNMEDGGAMYKFLMRDSDYPVVIGNGRNWNEIDGYLDAPGQPDLERISGSTNEIARELRGRGFPGVTFQDITDMGPNYKAASGAADMMSGKDRDMRRALLSEMNDAEIYSVFDPSTVRSPLAAFDPDQRNSSNIMAGVGAAAVGAGLLAAPQESEAGVLGSVLKPVAGQRISTRYPTAKAATEDPLAENLIINTDAMRVSPKAFDTNAGIVGGYNTTRTGAKSSEGRTRAFIDEAADNLLYIFDNVRPEVRDVSKQWYVGANRIANELSEKHGVTVETASGVLAALSPQKDWYQNASLAERVLSVYRNGTNAPLPGEAIETARRIYGKPQYAEDLKAVETKPFEALTDNQKAMFIRSYDQTFNPRGYDIISPTGERVGPATTKAGNPGVTAWGSNSEIAKAIRVIENPTIENISAQMGQQHKVRNFYNNIVDPMYAQNNPSIGDITADTHAVAADLMKPLGGSALEVTHNFGGAGSASSALSGAQGTYGMHADAYRKAAAEAGVMPREMQSITWEAIRGLFPASFKTKNNVADINGVWDLYSKGKLSKDAARALIVEKAGGMDDPDWVVRPDSGIALPAGAASDKGVLSESGVSRSGGVDSRTRFIAAGMPAEWLGLGGAGAGAAGAVIRNPDGSTRKMTAMEQAMYDESQARIQPMIDAMAQDPGYIYGDLLPVKRMEDPAAREADSFGGFRPAIPNVLRDLAGSALRVSEGARTGMLDERALQELLF